MIAAALRTLEDTGQLPQSMQELAKNSGVTTVDVLESFTSSDALRIALIGHGLVRLADALREGVVSADPEDPTAQLRALSQAYFAWGAHNRALFRLLATALLDPAVAEGSELERYRHSIRDLVMKKFAECQSRGLIRSDADLQIILANTHSILLGVSSTLVNDRRDAWYEGEATDLQQLADEMMKAYFDQIFGPASA
ncbi:TetR/AcrR family transcriptional regulator [Paracoccus aminophilus]|nr:hypothetical protein [Paracoccus aminophilus]